MRSTVDFGIDLGTTNSAIALTQAGRSDLIDGLGGPLVPSVVHFDSAGKVSVGRSALDRLPAESADTVREFKRLMGSGEQILFPASGRRLKPLELSAEILRFLAERAAQATSEKVEAAVITIPAMFHLAQCEDTRAAATLAGIRYAPLLQEPIAAAIASAGSPDLREGYWLVYDLGGGTFDVTLVRARGGRLAVVDHDGDNHLGGKDLDRLLIRSAAEKVRIAGVQDFKQSNTDFQSAFDRLKVEAERVRVQLSERDGAWFEVPQIAPGIDLGFEISREEFEEMAQSVLLRTTELCKRVLDRNQVKSSDVRRLVLVGGPTLTPSIPALLEERLGVEARHYVDPSKAVAIGAAIYAATQRIPTELRLIESNVLAFDLSYEAMTVDPFPYLAGRIMGHLGPGSWQVAVCGSDGNPAVDPVLVGANGAFFAKIPLKQGSLNAFTLAAMHDGQSVTVEGGSFSIIHGSTIAKPVLSQSVGVLVSDGSVRWYVRKGSTLPARETVVHTTTISLAKGESGTAIDVPIIQGEHKRGERNIVVGILQIRAESLARDLPVGSEVVVTLTVDEHSTTSATAVVPLLDRSYDEVVKFGIETPTSDSIQSDFQKQQGRLAELERMLEDLGSEESGAIDDRVRLISELVEEGAADDLQQADHLLRGMSTLIDEMENRDQESVLSQQFEATTSNVLNMLGAGDPALKRQTMALAEEFKDALALGDLRLAEAKKSALERIEFSLQLEDPQFWVGLFSYACGRLADDPRATPIIQDGTNALKHNRIEELQTATQKLWAMLPFEEQTNVMLSSHVR